MNLLDTYSKSTLLSTNPPKMAPPEDEAEASGWEDESDIRLPPSLAARVTQRSEEALTKFVTTTSRYASKGAKRHVATFYHDDIELGELLGHGAFSNIFAVQKIDPPVSFSSSSSRGDDKGSNHTHTTTDSMENSSPGFKTKNIAVKVLRPKLLSNPARMAIGATDLVTEAFIMASLHHPNILRLRGWSALGVKGYSSGRHDGFFIVLDRIQGTLEDRLPEWEARNRRLRRGIFQGGKRNTLLVERLKVAEQVAEALVYLHEHNVIHRDLKPANVGFDEHGNVKIFDFGLAKFIPSHIYDFETFKLTGNTGSTRYMAPEVGRHESYNAKADIYSFSVMLYEMMALQSPFLGWTRDEIEDRVHYGGERPACCRSWPARVQQTVKQGWDDDIRSRLSAQQCRDLLHEELEHASNQWFLRK